jgi:hypothetical protein
MNFLILVTVIVIAVLVWKISGLLPDLTYQLRELQADISAIRGALTSKDSDAPESPSPAKGGAFMPKDEGEADE